MVEEGAPEGEENQVVAGTVEGDKGPGWGVMVSKRSWWRRKSWVKEGLGREMKAMVREGLVVGV
jgi:hypothetical protein